MNDEGGTKTLDELFSHCEQLVETLSQVNYFFYDLFWSTKNWLKTGFTTSLLLSPFLIQCIFSRLF